MSRQRQEVGPRGEWKPALHGCALYFSGIERGIEIPLDHLDTPHELWGTIIHFGVEKSCREQLGWPCSDHDDNADLGALIMAIRDLCDLTRIYLNGMSSDPWNGTLNQLTRWLRREIARLPEQPSWRDYAILGRRVREHAEFLDLNEVFDLDRPRSEDRRRAYLTSDMKLREHAAERSFEPGSTGRENEDRPRSSERP